MGADPPRDAELLAQGPASGGEGRDKVFADDVDYRLGPKPVDHDVAEIERGLDERGDNGKKRKR